MNDSAEERTRPGYPWVVAWMILCALHCCGCAVILREAEVEARLKQVEGKAVTLDEPIFGRRVAMTGVWAHCLFQKVIGFGIFETTGHEPGRLPVLLMHGHADGPVSMKAVAAALDPGKFEPMFAFYPTGQKLAFTVKSMHARLAAFAKKKKTGKMAVVAYSMSGLIARKYLGERSLKNMAPEVGILITVSTPWNGSERGARWAWSPAAPPSWEDMSPGSDFLRHLFDQPLPESTDFHLLYGTHGDKWNIPGPDDGTISVKSASRKDAIEEADSVTVYPACSHRAMVRKKEPLLKISGLLEAYYKKMAR